MTSSLLNSYPYDLGLKNYEEACLFEFTLPKKYAHTSEGDEILFWLKNGLIWIYAFNHEESIVCFQNALKIDDKIAMAYWGMALSHAPNYNTLQMTRNDFPSAFLAFEYAKRAFEIMSESKLEADNVDANESYQLSRTECKLIEALQVRFLDPLNIPEDCVAIEANKVEYSKALEEVYLSETKLIKMDVDKNAEDINSLRKCFPTNYACVSCLYAESLCQFDPWHLWDLDTGEPKLKSLLIKEVVSNAMKFAPKHPGLCHFMIHLMEMSPTPEAALGACDVLYKQRCYPDAGHLVHMPSHIYVLLGSWRDAIDANVQASRVDQKYLDREGIFKYYTGYRVHNLHFISYAAMFVNDYETAIKAAKQLKGGFTHELIAHPVLSTYYEAFCTIDIDVYVRFGKWEELIAIEIDQYYQPECMKDGRSIYPYTICLNWYGKGIAHAVLGNISKAKECYEAYMAAIEDIPSDRVRHNNKCTELVKIGEAMLLGELYYREQEYAKGFEKLHLAVELSDALVYDEPWGWMMPPRHALGALYLEQGHVEGAIVQFQQDMDRHAMIGRAHPDNIWALGGLYRCYSKLIQEGSVINTSIYPLQDRNRDELIQEMHVLWEKINHMNGATVACMCATADGAIMLQPPPVTDEKSVEQNSKGCCSCK